MDRPCSTVSSELLALGKTIRRLREKLQISQEILAERCGLHRTYVSDIERGGRNPSFLSLLAIARALGVTISELIGDIGTKDPPSQSASKHRVLSRTTVRPATVKKLHYLHGLPLCTNRRE